MGKYGSGSKGVGIKIKKWSLMKIPMKSNETNGKTKTPFLSF